MQQVRIVVRWKPLQVSKSVQEVCRSLGHVPCLIGGHDEELCLGIERLAVRCRRCGWRSPGFTVGAGSAHAAMGSRHGEATR
jgi:hypothetical protein